MENGEGRVKAKMDMKMHYCQTFTRCGMSVQKGTATRYERALQLLFLKKSVEASK
jgi:hypothetical protein